MQLIDTHVHVNFESFDADFDAVRDRWRSAGIVRLVHSCVRPEEFEKTRSIADLVPELSFAVGLHPLEAHRWTTQTASEIARLAQSDPRVAAIGETGLDFYKSDDVDRQREAFWEQLKIARQLDLAVIVHCRDAAADAADLLRKFWSENGPVRGVMHCWTGTPEETQWFLDLGFYISFSGVVTFKNAGSVRKSAILVPNDRLLVETDCPFLSPVPKRKEKRNEPAYVRYVAEYIAELRQTPVETLAAETTQNAVDCFNLNER
ncbi:MAG: TatD family hydrolase [Cyanobacteria bacterium SID2]|nr:TatD family hydrolase [Cyanobacteria bacterium SID2]MBP0005618.1 TatD family hydrolase [Cyanobacteria bacterium SBC]